MATYVDLDSTLRKRDIYENPAKYDLEASQVAGWNRAPRKVTANSFRPGSRVIEFAQSVRVKHVILPYTDITYTDSTGASIATHTADLQRLYLDVHTSRYNDLHLINTIDGKISKARFVLIRDKIQLDNASAPKWVLFECRMDQVMRFARDESIHFELMHLSGQTIIITDTDPIDPELQTTCLLEITPYVRDARYDNHTTGLTQF